MASNEVHSKGIQRRVLIGERMVEWLAQVERPMLAVCPDVYSYAEPSCTVPLTKVVGTLLEIGRAEQLSSIFLFKSSQIPSTQFPWHHGRARRTKLAH